MVQSNKVLTVSYGTFSCTLEGFEDSFDTMKAIAEYFRDLAADDRYFGAEPPQPDTEMLARIAEREIARQVEARREGAGYVLRAAAPAELAEAAQAPPQAAPQAAAEPAPEPTPAPEEEIAQAVSEAPAEPVAEPEAVQAEEAPAAETVAEAETEEVAAVGVSEEAAAFMAQAEPVAEEAAAFEPEADEVEAEAPEAEELEAEPVTAEAALDPDSIAAKLQRIRAVVSRNEAVAVQADYSEDEHFEDALAAAEETAESPELSAEAAELEPAAEAEAAPVEAAAEEPVEETVAEAEQDTAEPAQEEAEEDPFAGLDPRRAARLRRRMARAQQAAEGQADAAAEAALQARAAQDARDETAEAEDDSALFADLNAEPATAGDEARDEDHGDNILAEGTGRGADRRRPRVMIVKRDEHEPEAEAAAPLMPSAELPPGTLPPEDEADLMRELAEVEAELRGDSATEPPEQEAEPEAEYRPAPQAAREETSDLSRLMAAADEKLDAAEAAATRETYSHLRAAVAATQAERSSGGSVDTNPDAAAYRADLARVVHPRRPRPGATRGTRPGADEQPKPAPLKLVAEQRVDDIPVQAAKSGPVRPRRIAAAVEEAAPVAAGESFAAFAEEMGAQELPELLEAAAAYMQFVEGRDQFTRPQLIHKAREAADDEFSREDGLRSFGMLLREGKIVKKDSGRFVASGDIGFQPASSRAAG